MKGRFSVWKNVTFALAILASSALASLLTTPAIAQGDPPIRIIYPFPAGGAGDAMIRLIAERMQTALGRTVLVDNRSGGGGRIGVQAVKAAIPDGATLLFTVIAPI